MEKRNKKTKSVGNGEGTLYYSETLCCYVFQYWKSGTRHTMKQKKKETVKHFKERVTKIKASLNDGTYTEKSSETVLSLAEKYINQKYTDQEISPRSYARALETLNQIKKTCSNFCNIPIQKVTIEHIEQAKIEIKKYSNSVIDKIWSLLKNVFNIACSPSRRILIYNLINDPTLKKPISDKKTKKVTSLNDKEYEKLLNVLDNEEKKHPYRNIIKFQCASGMRIGEVLARSKGNYNKKDKTLLVDSTLTQDEHYKIILSNHTKTYNKKTQIDEGKRIFPLDNALFSELKSIIEEECSKKITNIYNLLFWNYKKNKFISPSEINSWLYRLNKKYHICEGSLSTHRIRHTVITNWRNLGIPMSVIQYLAGHVEGSSITNVYIDTNFEYVHEEILKKYGTT